MASWFQTAAARMQRGPMIIVIWLILLAGFFVSLGIAYEDYTTSLLGHQAVPTQKANDWVVYAVALLPQLVQIILLFNFLTDTTNKQWSLWAAVAAHAIDVGLDVYYKSSHFATAALTVTAFIESELVFTLCSEVLMSVCFGLLIITTPDFIMQSKIAFGRITSAISSEGGSQSGGRNFSGGDSSEPRGESPRYAPGSAHPGVGAQRPMLPGPLSGKPRPMSPGPLSQSSGRGIPPMPRPEDIDPRITERHPKGTQVTNGARGVMEVRTPGPMSKLSGLIPGKKGKPQGKPR